MGDKNPRTMYGVIITVYVDRETTTIRSFRQRGKNDNEKNWKREIGKTRGYDRRASLLAYVRRMRAESLDGELKRDGGESENKKQDRPNPKKKKRKWIRRMMSKFRLPLLRPFRLKNRAWRYCQIDPDEEEAKRHKAYNYDIWKKLKGMLGGCVRSRRD